MEVDPSTPPVFGGGHNANLKPIKSYLLRAGEGEIEISITSVLEIKMKYSIIEIDDKKHHDAPIHTMFTF